MRAADSGSSPLDDICIVKVRISDINDNEPLFDQQHYDFGAPQDALVGETSFQISAVDADNGENGTVSYFLEAISTKDEGFFEIGEDSGLIRLRKHLSRVKQVEYFSG